MVTAHVSSPSTVCRIVRSGRVWICADDLGLTEGAFYALAQDARGYMWIGTEDGPVMFDGLVWSAPARLEALRGWLPASFSIGGDSALWVGANGQGLSRVELGEMLPRVTSCLTMGDGV